MSTAAEFTSDPRINDVRVTANEIIARLADGREISVPLAWSWRLSEATPKQQGSFRLSGPVRQAGQFQNGASETCGMCLYLTCKVA